MEAECGLMSPAVCGQWLPDWLPAHLACQTCDAAAFAPPDRFWPQTSCGSTYYLLGPEMEVDTFSGEACRCADPPRACARGRASRREPGPRVSWSRGCRSSWRRCWRPGRPPRKHLSPRRWLNGGGRPHVLCQAGRAGW